MPAKIQIERAYQFLKHQKRSTRKPFSALFPPHWFCVNKLSPISVGVIILLQSLRVSLIAKRDELLQTVNTIKQLNTIQKAIYQMESLVVAFSECYPQPITEIDTLIYSIYLWQDSLQRKSLCEGSRTCFGLVITAVFD